MTNNEATRAITHSGFGKSSKMVAPRVYENVGRQVEAPNVLRRVVGFIETHRFKLSLSRKRSARRPPHPQQRSSDQTSGANSSCTRNKS
jgi:hypothetical protein